MVSDFIKPPTHYLTTLLLVGGMLLVPGISQAQIGMENDPGLSISGNSESFDELLTESRLLLATGRPIDARAKLQQALKIRPNDYRPHMLLGQYYLFNVSHFKLAYRYLKTAEKHFAEVYGNDLDGTLSEEAGGEHAILLYLLSEAELNLDRYQESLDTLDRFEKLYWLDWYPGTRAWVLMKLKRVDEAIQVAQAGLARDADPRRTWNILGILLSIKGNRSLSLHAFQQAIKAELSLQGSGMIATPLNNAGEVYRELFEDDHAEAAWLKAVRLPDGCEHILPSLNLAHIYLDQLRLFQAERSLKDFESCFAAESIRKDTEHRALLALARGKIALLSNDLENALELVRQAAEEEQWFGKIGTNQNDVAFAAHVAFAQALDAEAEALRDREFENLHDKAMALVRIPFLEVRSWWLNRQARRIGLEELDDLEDLFVRNTDSMVAYPTLGSALAGFDERSLRKRVQRMIQSDPRPQAHLYYRLYLAENLIAHGDTDEAKEILEKLEHAFPENERLVRAEVLSDLLKLQEDEGSGIFSSLSPEDEALRVTRSNQLFSLLPSHLRFHGLPLPVFVSTTPVDPTSTDILSGLASDLLKRRFERRSGAVTTDGYSLALTAGVKTADGSYPVSIHLLDNESNRQLVVQTGSVDADGKGRASLVNEFIQKAFAHRSDPPSQGALTVPILKGILQ